MSAISERYEAYLDLGKDVRRRVDPISAEQLNEFRQSPEVLIPSQAVEIERHDFGENSDWFVRTNDEQLAWIERVPNEAWHLHIGASVHGLGTDDGEQNYELLAFVHQKPLWLMRPVYPTQPCSMYLEKDLLAQELTINAVTTFPDHTIIFSFRSASSWQAKVIGTFRRGHPPLDRQKSLDGQKGGYRFHRAIQTADLRLWYIWKHEDQKNHLVSREHHPAYCAQHTLDIVSAPNEKLYVIDQERNGPVKLYQWSYTDTGGSFIYITDIGDASYISSFRFLNGPLTFAYIGSAAHQRQRWVIGREPQPAFRWVSQMFDDPVHGLCYWGVIDNALLTMKV